jgi:hypothetical protein
LRSLNKSKDDLREGPASAGLSREYRRKTNFNSTRLEGQHRRIIYQLDWTRNKMPNRSKPMGTIYQPEASARAVYYSAYHGVREFIVGNSTLVAIIGNKLFPGIGDRFLAREGYKGQQTTEKAEQRPDNLFDPVEGDYKAHGRFDKKAKSKSNEVWLGMHPQIPVAAAVFTFLKAVALLLKR